jgi:hypothetical protein
LRRAHWRNSRDVAVTLSTAFSHRGRIDSQFPCPPHANWIHSGRSRQTPPTPQNRLHQCERSHRSCIRAQNTRAKRNSHAIRRRTSRTLIRSHSHRADQRRRQIQARTC